MHKVLFFIYCSAFCLLAGPKAQWLTYPEDVNEGINKERYLRTEFNVAKKAIKKAFVAYVIDDTGNVMLNGKAVEHQRTRIFGNGNTKQYDITKELVSGANALCATTINNGGPGGFILHISITYQDGSEQEVFTDTTWRASRKKQPGWEKAGFAAKEWKTPASAGDYLSDPWAGKYDFIAILANDDAAAERERRQQVAQRTKKLLEKLATEPELQAKIAYKDGGVFIDLGGKLYRPVLYNYSAGGRDTPNFREKLQNFADADMHLLSCGIEADQFWKGPEQYDYQAIDKHLARAFTQSPEGRFIFAITFSHGPQWWNQLHPEETIRYGRKSTKYSKGDNIGPYNAPSYASELWIKEASETVRRLVKHIEGTPYAKRIFGYRLGAGVYSEWHYYGMADSMPDVSEPMKRLFRAYLREKYQGDLEQLRKAWRQSEVTFESAEPPSEAVRMQVLDGVLRDPVKHAWTLDFLHCMQRSLSNALLAINKAAKEACNGRALIGNYCGYFFGMGYTAEGWHIVNDVFMDSPYVDFQISPCCYTSFYRKLGASQLSRSLWSSYPLHGKMCIFEADTRTHLTQKNSNKHATTAKESVALLSRDLAQAISKGSAFWYYDFGCDWYNCPEILQFFHCIAPIYDAVKDFSSSAEVAVIADWESAYYHAIQAPEGGPQVSLSMNNQPRELNNAGILFDAFSFADIDNPALQKYKLFIFPQLFYMTPEKLAKLSAIKKAGKTLLFLNAAGWLTANGPDNNSIFQTTGIHTEAFDQSASMAVTLANGSVMDSSGRGANYAPVLKITDTNASILGTAKMRDGTKVPAYAKKKNSDGSVTYLCSTPVVSASELRKIAKEIGVHTYCDSGKGVVFANNSMISFHTATPGKYTLRAKAPVKWTMVYPEKRTYPKTQAELTFTAAEPNTYIFMIAP
ncbi:MAG: beta-galactosidase trimerization domain-containing protein [Victivallales bacterium]|nr:beta-galactosidase trimerization domain-containing protein [Victivallales bacterium]